MMTDGSHAHQPDLFADEYEKPRVFPCAGGAYIGVFNRFAGEDDEPTLRLSAYLPSVATAEAALAARSWPSAEQDDGRWSSRVTSEHQRRFRAVMKL